MGSKVRLLLVILLTTYVSVRAQDTPVATRIDAVIDTLSHLRTAGSADSIELKILAPVEKLESSLDSLQTFTGSLLTRFQVMLDSIKQNGGSTGELLRRMDSVMLWKDRKLSMLKARADSLKARIESKTRLLQTPATSVLTERLDKLVTDLDLHTTGVLPAGALDIGQGIPSIDGDISSVLDPLKEHIPQAPAAQPGVAEIAGSSKDLESKVSQELSSMKERSVEQLNETIGVENIQTEMSKAGELDQKLAGLSDEDAAKEMLAGQFRQQAVDHFAGRQAQIDAAIEKLSKYKDKFENAPDITQLPKRPPNPMRGRPFAQRLLPGVALQISRKDAWLVDIYPYVGYRMTGHLTGGLGWNHRVGYNTSARRMSNQLSIFGPRAYGEYLIAKGFSARVEAEFMKAAVPAQFSSGHVDESGREWVFGMFAGMKKSYRLIKRINGTAMVLYNIYSPEHRSPYQQRLAMRIGFELEARNRMNRRSK